MEWFLYFIKVNVSLSVWYGLYRLLSGRDTFFCLKRFILLFALIFSFSYPLIDMIELGTSSQTWNVFMQTNPMSVYLDEVIITADSKVGGFTFLSFLNILYVAGAGMLFIKMIWELILVVSLLIKSERKNIKGYNVWTNNRVDAPFSFFSFIVINPEKHNDKELKEILLHEEAHARQKHSWDVLLCELVCVFFWFNPFVWLIRNEIKINLEYLADREVLSSGCNSQNYQFHLLRLTYNKAAAKLVNNFNVSLLKKRIMMMNKKQTKQFGLMKYLLFVPMIAGLFFFSQCAKQKEKEVEAENIVVQEEYIQPEVKEEVEMDEVTITTQEESTEKPSKETAPKEKYSSGKPIRVFIDNETGKTYESVLEKTEQMPSFPGGEAALYEILYKELTYPEEAQRKRIEGTVHLRFIVGKEGEVGLVSLLKGVHPLLNEEAARAIKKLPNFNPAMQDGKPVNVWVNLPVTFRLEK